MKKRQGSVGRERLSVTGLGGAFLLTASLLLSGCGQKSDDSQALLSQTANQVIVPLYREFNEQSQTLVTQTQAFCADSEQTAQALANVQQQWRETMAAWARVQPIRFGPVDQGNWRWKIQFWPDRKDITRKKVEALIASDDELTAERVASASVPVQGLVALEYLLFDPRGSAVEGYQQNARRCELLLATAERVEQVSATVLNEWRDDYAKSFSSPGEGNSRYPELQTTLADLISSLVVGAEVVKLNKLGLPMATGKGAGYAKPYRLEAWRSQYSLELMKASTETLKSLYQAEGVFGLADYLRTRPEVDEAKIAAIGQAFDAVDQQFATLKGPVFTQIKQPEYYAKLVELHSALAVLESSLGELPEMLDINLGFNSNDGD